MEGSPFFFWLFSLNQWKQKGISRDQCPGLKTMLQRKKKQKEGVPIRSGSILKCFSNVRSHSRTSALGFPCCIATLGRFPSIEQPPNSGLRPNSNVDTRLSKTLFSTKHKADREPTNEWIHLFIDRNSAYRKTWNFPVNCKWISFALKGRTIQTLDKLWVLTIIRYINICNHPYLCRACQIFGDDISNDIGANFVRIHYILHDIYSW